MDINLFDYILPDELIAQYPSRQRDESRLMVVDRKSKDISITSFPAILDYINANDCMVVNNTKVFKARIFGNRQTGAEVEIFLVRKYDDDPLMWEALAQPSRRLKDGEEIYFHSKCHTDKLSLTLETYLGDGRWRIHFQSIISRDTIIERYGHIPLPQYIKRTDAPEDIDRYQTVFARDDLAGAVAAPTAGFHFTPSLLSAIQKKGTTIAEVTLHVGPGTFKPVQTDNINSHTVDREFAILPEAVGQKLSHTRVGGGKIMAVGTTSTRTIESANVTSENVEPFSRMVDLYIKPGYEFKLVDRLLTNFHLPKSSLLILVSAFAGRELILSAYERAIKEKFRFYSYGDAMLIL